MRWARGGQPSDLAPEAVEGLEELAHELELAAAEAPPSPRVDDVRMRLLASLDDVDAGARPMGRALLAAVVVLLLAMMVAVGAPAVGSLFEGALDEASPSPIVPSPSQDPASRGESEDVSRVPRVPTDGAQPSPGSDEAGAAADVPASLPGGNDGPPAGEPGQGGGATPVPIPTPTPVPWPPGEPPVEVPSPPAEPPLPPVEPPVPPSISPPVTPGP